MLTTATNPNADQSVNTLLNGLNVSSVTSGSRTLAFAPSGNGGGSDQIGGASDAVLVVTGSGVTETVTSITLTSNDGSEFELTSLAFAFEASLLFYLETHE